MERNKKKGIKKPPSGGGSSGPGANSVTDSFDSGSSTASQARRLADESAEASGKFAKLFERVDWKKTLGSVKAGAGGLLRGAAPAITFTAAYYLTKHTFGKSAGDSFGDLAYSAHVYFTPPGQNVYEADESWVRSDVGAYTIHLANGFEKDEFSGMGEALGDVSYWIANEDELAGGRETVNDLEVRDEGSAFASQTMERLNDGEYSAALDSIFFGVYRAINNNESQEANYEEYARSDAFAYFSQGME